MRIPPQNIAPLIVATVFAVVAFMFWPTVSLLLGLARESDQGPEAIVMVVVAFVLIWNMRSGLVSLPVRPCYFGFIGLAGLGFVWLAGELVFARAITQLAVLGMTPMIVLTMLGFAWLRAMLFPFLIMFFAVSVWSPLTPTLVKWTAKFAELGLQASGIPVYREGAFFVVPTGSWTVADTCSGVMFFSTCLLLGILYAWTMYQSPVKRALLVAGAAAIGIVGNWVRVYLTIVIAHVTDNRLLRDDHYMFGWYLFAIFLSIYFWFAWRYRDTEQLSHSSSSARLEESPATSSQMAESGRRLVIMFFATCAMLLVWRIVGTQLTNTPAVATSGVAEIETASGWSRLASPSLEWVPEIRNPSQVRVQAFEKDNQRVNVFIGIYRKENWDSKLVTVTNRLAGGDGSKWSIVDRGTAQTGMGSTQFQTKSAILLGKSERILAWHWYWINGLSTESDLRAKYQQLLLRLKSEPVASAWVTIYVSDELPGDKSSRLLQSFMQDMGGSLEKALGLTAAR